MPRGNLRQDIAYDDLREWLAIADGLGELRSVDGANWQEEIGMAAEIVSHDEDAPAVLFDNVPGCAPGFRVLVNVFGGRRMRATLGFPGELTKAELSEALLDFGFAEERSLPVETVTTGPVLENVLTGADVDLSIFPTPQWHEGDGGRYIGTGCYNVSRHPDSGWINLGCYRIMVKGRDTVSYNAAPGKHGRVHHEAWAKRGEKMPVAMVVGGDPLLFLMAGQEVADGVCEYDTVGGLRGRPVRVVPGPVTGLPIPADAEIVLEGWVDPQATVPEGPFGDWTGTYTEAGRVRPLVEVASICHRNDPIILGCPPQRPPDEYSRLCAVMRSAMLKRNLQDAGVPDVGSVWCHEVGGARLLIGVSITQRYPGHARQAGQVAASCLLGAYACKWIVVVDDDIDVSELNQLMWAWLTLADPVRSVDIFKGGWTSPADPTVTPWDRAAGNLTNNRAIVDACRPYHWRDEFPALNVPSPEVARRAKEKFSWLLDGN
ncbi:MAG: UbiD family decarboxylase [Alphaproteobacteria bacterium]|nr:UbiD family decarboxylase [Alphaproteobacteria bacterium]